jgi:hypothetical protein
MWQVPLETYGWSIVVGNQEIVSIRVRSWKIPARPVVRIETPKLASAAIDQSYYEQQLNNPVERQRAE